MNQKRLFVHLTVAAGSLLVAGAVGVAPALAATDCGRAGGASPLKAAAVSGTLNGVAATSARNAWAVGSTSAFTPLILRWNGTAWVPAVSPSVKDGQLLGVAAVSARSAWAVGSDVRGTLILSWNGTAWKQVRSPNPARHPIVLQGVAATSARNAWAVGFGSTRSHDQKTLIVHWDGTAWKQVPAPGPVDSELTAVAVTSPWNAWAVGNASGRTLILRWNGFVWKRVRSAALAAGTLFGITATSAQNAWAVGYTAAGPSARPLILHWNGTAWKRVPSPNPPSQPRGNWLFGVSAVSARSAWAVGGTSVTSASSGTFVLHWNGATWKRVRSPSPPGGPNLFGVAATSARNAWAVGYTTNGPFHAVILHWNGARWTRQV